MTYGEAYFAQYPFNIPITLFNYLVLNIAKLIGIPESGYMLTIQCVYLAGTDLAVFFFLPDFADAAAPEHGHAVCPAVHHQSAQYMYDFACYTTILMRRFSWAICCCFSPC